MTTLQPNPLQCPCGDKECDRRHLKVEFSERAYFQTDYLDDLLTGKRRQAFLGEAETVYIPYIRVVWNLSEPEDFELVEEVAQIMGDRSAVCRSQLISIDLKQFYTFDGTPFQEVGGKYPIAIAAKNHQQALYACMVAKDAIENPDLDEGSRVEALRNAWRYLNHALQQAEAQFNLAGIETLIEEPSPHSI